MTDVSLAGAFLAGLVSFLSPCVLPLVPGYISMLSGVGMEQLRKGEVPSSSLLGSSLSFIAGFSVVFISFGASASAVGRKCPGSEGIERRWLQGIIVDPSDVITVVEIVRELRHLTESRANRKHPHQQSCPNALGENFPNSLSLH